MSTSLDNMELPPCLVRTGFGDYRLAGHRISLATFVEAAWSDPTGRLEALSDRFPTVEPEIMTAVLRFCDENRPAVEAYHREAIERARHMRETSPGLTWSEIERRLQERLGSNSPR